MTARLPGRSFLKTIPGVLTAIAAVVAPVATLLAIFLPQHGGPAPAPASAAATTSLAAWSRQVDRICEGLAALEAPLARQASRAQSLAAEESAFRKFAHAGEELLVSVAAIDLPAGHEYTVQQWLGDWREQIGQIEGAMHAPTLSSLRASLKETQPRGRDMDRLDRKLGLTHCGH